MTWGLSDIINDDEYVEHCYKCRAKEDFDTIIMYDIDGNPVCEDCLITDEPEYDFGY